MRTILILSVLLSLSNLAAAVEPAPVRAPSAVRCSAQATPDRTILTLQDDSATPFANPVARLVVIPPTGSPRVRLLSTDTGEDAPIDLVTGTPMIMRGLRILPVTVMPRPSEPGKTAQPLPRTIEIDIRCDDTAMSADAPSSVLRYSRGYFDAYAGMIPAEQLAMLPATDEGSYLIITDPLYVPAIEPLAAWKRAKGLNVIIATTTETGTQTTDVQAYISNLYHQSTRPPQYVLIVADAPDASYPQGVAGFDFEQAISDHPYSMVDGDDFLPDLHVGRLPARNLADAENMVARIIRHEQSPYTDEGTEWFARGLVVGGNQPTETPVPVSRWCREQMLEIGFTKVDSLYFPPFSGDPLRVIPRTIDAGVSLVTYRGWADGTRGWDVPKFISDPGIISLNNGWKLPVVFSFVCMNNKFDCLDCGGGCFGEAWLRSGTSTHPKGAVAFIGNSESWSHTRFNDACAIQAFDTIRKGTRNLSEILDAFKMGLLVQFPTEIPWAGGDKESVEFYFYIYGLLGDPEMDIWTAAPIPISVQYAPSIPRGSNFLDVNVTQAGSVAPVEGARVGLSQGNAVLATGWTDAQGHVRLTGDFDSIADPVAVTVTGVGVAPHTGTTQVLEGQPYLAFDSVTISDDEAGSSHGNADGVPNPGETLELNIRIRNTGPAATGIHATLRPTPGFVVESGTIDYADIPAGGVAFPTTPFVVRLDPLLGDRFTAHLELDVESEASHSFADIPITVVAPDLSAESHTVDGDGFLSPGETVNLSVSLRNDGSIASPTVSAVLRAVTPNVAVVTDSTAEFAPIEPGVVGPSTPGFAARANSVRSVSALSRSSN